jgi:hypothetical protein
MSTVAVIGTEDSLGRRVCGGLRSSAWVDGVVTVSEARLAGVDLKDVLQGAAAVVQLCGGVDDTRMVLDAAGSVGVEHVVLLSSATAYGAWPENPVPLTEDAPLRPNPEFDFGVRAGQRERLAADWVTDHPGVTVAVLRPTTPVSGDASGWLAGALRRAGALRAVDRDDPPGQFVHLDDLAAAVVRAARGDLSGPFNVAPDGWIDGEELVALAGGPRLRLPERMISAVGRGVARVVRSAPEGIAPYTLHPWVVANDRLRATGWAPTYSNEEAYVVGHRPTPWAAVSPRRRQELALGAAGVAVLATFLGAAVGLRRWRRRVRALLAD